MTKGGKKKKEIVKKYFMVRINDIKKIFYENVTFAGYINDQKPNCYHLKLIIRLAQRSGLPCAPQCQRLDTIGTLRQICAQETQDFKLKAQGLPKFTFT